MAITIIIGDKMINAKAEIETSNTLLSKWLTEMLSPS
jgi:hypothetical protein